MALNPALSDCAQPAWFPVKLDANARQIHFVHTTRANLSSAPFLDERFETDRKGWRSLSLEEAACITGHPAGGAVSPPSFVFHTAFCCSTLLARALDRPGRALSLKEPGILMDLANARRTHPEFGADRARFQSLAQTVFGLLGRRFEPDEHVLVKPTNAANRLLSAATAQDARILLLYPDLTSFLVSVIKKGEACRYFVRHLLNIFRLDRPDINAWPHRELMLLTDLQVAALVWNLQVELFQHVLAEGGKENRIRTLHTERFLDNPAGVLFDVQAFFGLGYTSADASAIAGSALFQRHAKFPGQDYDKAVRQAEKAQILKQYSGEISTTLEWTRRLRQSAVPERLTHSL